MKTSQTLLPSLALLSALLLSGCATTSMLPANAGAVDFGSTEGKTGWSKYEQVESFSGYSLQQVFAAVKVGLGDAGFSLRRADVSQGIAVGEHGMTAHDWNVLAGVYLKQEGSAVLVKIIVEGSKDIGLSGDVTGDGWAGKILKGTRGYLNETHQAVLKVDRADLK